MTNKRATTPLDPDDAAIEQLVQRAWNLGYAQGANAEIKRHGGTQFREVTEPKRALDRARNAVRRLVKETT